ncbi:MAG: RNA polymerase sigma factor [Planctomycetes bacterium]|nr:RNA polymerase sigma factor [Planctomycetota bacterium]
MDASESTLLARATGGDVDALSALLEQSGPRVRQELTIQKQWQSALDIDDVMQITYMEAFLQIGRFTPCGPDSFLAWLRQIARNNLRDALKGLARDKRPPPNRQVGPQPDTDSYVALCDLLGATTTTPSRAAASRETRCMLDSAIAELPPDYAQVIRLHDLEGRAGPEVARAMGRSRGAVFMLLARAHDRLRVKLGSETKFFSWST